MYVIPSLVGIFSGSCGFKHGSFLRGEHPQWESWSWTIEAWGSAGGWGVWKSVVEGSRYCYSNCKVHNRCEILWKVGETPYVRKSVFLVINRRLAFAPSVFVNIVIKMENRHKLFSGTDVLLNGCSRCTLPSRIMSCAS